MPSKIAYLAHHAWSDAKRGAWPPNIPAQKQVSYDIAVIKRWLGIPIKTTKPEKIPTKLIRTCTIV